LSKTTQIPLKMEIFRYLEEQRGILRSGRKLCTSLALCWRDPARKSACCIRRRTSDDEVTRACLFFSPPPHLSRKRILIRFAAAGAHIYFWPRAPDQEGGGDTGPNLLLALISLQPGQSADFNTFFCTNRRRPTRLLRHHASLSQKSSHRLHFVCFLPPQVGRNDAGGAAVT
jgi:hypothetical protein